MLPLDFRLFDEFLKFTASSQVDVEEADEDRLTIFSYSNIVLVFFFLERVLTQQLWSPI